MFGWQRTISLLLILSAAWLSGCNTSHARSAPPRSSPAKAQAAPPPVAKHPPRDSALAVYHNPAYGVSFRYPRNFELQEKFEPGSKEPLERQTGQQPSSISVAAVLIPNDGYPNTTFRGGWLQLVVNPLVPSETCQSFAVPTNPDWRESTGTSTISGVLFHWWQSGEFANHMDYWTRVYSGFFDGACYEFYLEVTDSVSMVPDPAEKPADSPKILRQLEKIIATVQLHPSAVNASGKPLPVVHSFTVESIPHPHLQNVVRVFWDISGAAENEVFLRVNCPSPILPDLNPLPDSTSAESASAQAAPTDPPTLDEASDRYTRPGYYRLESIFSCGSFTPIPARSGSFRLQIEKHSAEPVSFTLFVFHLDYLTAAIR
jgi:hypothetical protein